VTPELVAAICAVLGVIGTGLLTAFAAGRLAEAQRAQSKSHDSLVKAVQDLTATVTELRFAVTDGDIKTRHDIRGEMQTALGAVELRHRDLETRVRALEIDITGTSPGRAST